MKLVAVLIGVVTATFAVAGEEFIEVENRNLRSDLEIASRHVTAKAIRRRAAVTDGDLVQKPPAFIPGMHWKIVAAIPVLHQVTKKNLPKSKPQAEANVFEFKVLAVSGEVAEVEVRSTRSGEAVTAKFDQRRHLLAVSGKDTALGLDFFPLSIPSIDDLSAKKFSEDLAAQLPEALRSYTAEIITVSNRSAVQFVGEDAFQRQANVIWREGDPWPALIQGPAGVAVLLKGDSR